MKIRTFWVWLHRWTGLVTAGFLVVVGLTGALLAFYSELNHVLTPRLFPGPHPGIEMDAATLALRAETLVPQGWAKTVFLGDIGTARIGMKPKPGERPLDFAYICLDAVTGEELGRMKWGDVPRALDEVMEFVYALHYELALGVFGKWVLGFVALAWTLDCFVALYLTFPRRRRPPSPNFFARWTPAWLVKVRSSAYRVVFDLHRAGGLWLFAMLLIFAWSSVFWNMNGVYTQTMKLFFDYEKPVWARGKIEPPTGVEPLGWMEAQARGVRLMNEQAQKYGFTVVRPVALYFARDKGLYEFRVRSSRDVSDKYGSTSVHFDAYTGALEDVRIPSGQRSGNTITSWLVALHMANVFGLPYKILVCALGLTITMLSISGVYIWWKKRCARINRRVPAGASPARVSRSWRSVVSVAWSSATAAAKRTQQSRGVRD